MIRREADRLSVEGPVTLATLPTLLAAGAREIQSGARTVDLRGVTELDSAGVALLLEWRRAALATRADLTVEGLGPRLESLASLYGVEDLLPRPAGAG
jgi:phospholipid transport system transporter-binding protein